VAAGMTGTSNMGANVSQVAQTVAGLNDDNKNSSKNTVLGMLSVDLLGFGE
jgi:hypothetical protein